MRMDEEFTPPLRVGLTLMVRLVTGEISFLLVLMLWRLLLIVRCLLRDGFGPIFRFKLGLASESGLLRSSLLEC